MDGVGHQAAGFHQHGALVDEFLPDRIDLVKHHPLRDGVDHVDDVVDPRDQAVDVLAVDRRNVGLFEPIERLMRDAISRRVRLP